ncbi:MAG: metal-dependent hydrolase [Rhodocyclaceae bacterium]|nr:metal-dependent hydrolase [Rhodocyclaceae bacterium]
MTSENMSTPHPMDSILIRRLKFAFEQVQTSDLVWSRSCPNFSIFINALGVHVPHFERFLVAVLREIRGDLANPQLVKDVQAIIGQEAYHAFNFESWTRRLNAHYLRLPEIDAHAKNYFVRALETGSRKFKVGFVAGYETFTFLAGMIILDRYDQYMRDADPTLRALWVWHQVEEVEHGAVAFDVYKTCYGEHEWYRRQMVLLAFVHIVWETFKCYAEMIRVEGYYRKPWQAIKSGLFLARFGFDLGYAALPVLSASYHPRAHPLCNEQQNEIALAWRSWIAAGADAHHLSNENVAQMLAAYEGSFAAKTLTV